ncbi:MAG TPA: VOC family protein, partial [Terrimesophilobacter sp.]|nr:VOC family protein [Terrimesophilobacter sp.]
MTPPDTVRAGVHQLRVVVKADDFEEALTFYRDVLGMPEEESYEGDGGARVAILGAGRATLELSNPAQVDLIDRV